jgi:hypothetical protein
MEHRKFGLGYQRDLQSVREGNFAGLAEIRGMKNGFYFPCFKNVRRTHNLGSFYGKQEIQHHCQKCQGNEKEEV